MKNVLLTFLFALVGLQTFAQYDRPWLIHDNVKVIDEVTKKLVRGAEFTLFDTHGRQIEIAYSHEQAMTINGEEKFLGYSFSIEEFVDTLVVRATIPGHEPAEAIVPTPRNKYEEAKKKDGRFWWRDEIRLMTRRRMEFDLNEAEVKASRILMVQKGDTIIYNAAALQMSSGSMLNNLVRALPGVQLGANGRITVNGEYVESLLVNGKDFFKGDPNVALDNLPYYTVDKIKVYHRGPGELKNATHVDSLRAMAVEKALVMDVRLKKEYGEGWLANFEAAVGSHLNDSPPQSALHSETSPKSPVGEAGGRGQGAVHRGRAFALRFTDHSKLGIYASANNVGDNHNPTHNGEWREMQAAGSGENTMQNAGLDFSIENKEQTRKFETTLTAQHNDNDNETLTSAQDFYSTGDVFRRSRNWSTEKSGNLNWNASYSQSKIRKYSFSLSPRLFYSKSTRDAHGRSATFEGDPLDATRTASLDSIFSATVPATHPVTHPVTLPATVPAVFPAGHLSPRLRDLLITSQQNSTFTDSYNFNVALGTNLRIFLPFTKEYLSLNAGVSYRELGITRLSMRQVYKRSTGDYNENSHSLAPKTDFSWNAGAAHKLFHINGKLGWASANLSYNFHHDTSDEEQSLWKSDAPLFDAMPYGTFPDLPLLMEYEGSPWIYNLPNSYTTTETTDEHRFNISFMSTFGRNPKKSYTISAELPFAIINRSMTDERNAHTTRFHKQNFRASPQLHINHAGFSLSYNLQSQLPWLNQLLDVTDNSNSLFVNKGNPNLKNTLRHNFKLGYKYNNGKHAEWLNASMEAGVNQNDVQYGTTYDRTTGVTTMQPFNTDGNWWSSADFKYGRAFDKAKHFNGDLGLNYTFARSSSFASDASLLEPQLSVILNHRIRSNFHVGYSRGQMRVDLTGKFTWNDVRSDRANFQHLQYADHSYGLTFATPLFPGVGEDKWTIDFDTDVKLYLRRGYREPSMNTTEWVWNAALSTRVGKTKQWTLRAVGFDLLHQLSNITHSLTAQSFSETWTNTVRSYVSFHVVYHLQMKPKKGIE